MKEEYNLLGKAFSALPGRHKIFGFIVIAVLLVIFFVDVNPLFKLLVFVSFAVWLVWILAKAVKTVEEVKVQRRDGPKTFGAFISAPMASADNEAHRNSVNTSVGMVKSALQSTGVTKQIYYAGTDRPTEDRYDLPSAALTYNWEVLSQSEKYIAIIETEASSSTFLEVGAALSLGIPSVWFIKKDIKLPYLMSDPGNLSNAEQLPKVSTFRYDNLEDVAAKVRQHGLTIFS